jgi:ABC-type cobalamin/Fe3+-siderophores transport system ATPase subunit/dihydroneopterin aldolase
MLQQCYVGNRKLTEYSRDLQRLLEYNAVLDEPGESLEEIDESKLEQELELQLTSTKQRTVLLIGNVGAGKSTFVHRFIQSQKNPTKSISVVLDLIDEAVSNIEHNRQEEQRLAERILNQLADEFQNKVDPNDADVLRGCFEVELGKFKKLHRNLLQQDMSAYLLQEEELLYRLSSDKYAHLVGYLKNIRKRHYKVWIVFDNVDRGSDSYQEFIYAFAHRLANAANCVTLLTLREDTYLAAKSAGFLDVRNSDVAYQIVAPEFKQVVSRRRKYIQKLIHEERLPRPLKERLTLVELLSDHINQLVLSHDSTIRMLIATCSLSNVRYALRMLREYYTSFHSTFHATYNKSRDGKQPAILSLDMHLEHERFIQSLMLGNSWSYDEGSSEVINLFSADLLEQSSHFLVLRILAYMALERSNAYPRSAVTNEKITKDFIYLGYHRHHIVNAVTKLLATNLLLSPSFPVKEGYLTVPNPLPTDLKLSLSAKGYYYLKVLAGHPYYQVRVGEDSVWYDATLAAAYTKQLQESNKVQSSFKDDDALQGTNARDIFLQYLRKSLLAESEGGHIRPLSAEWARLIEDTIERSIFGTAITQSVYTSESQETTSFDILMGTQNAYSPSLLRHAQKQLNRRLQPRQMSLFGIGDADYGKAIEEALESLGELPKHIKYGKSRYVVRVLWALELASRAGLGPQRAGELGLLIRNYGQEHVAGQNVAQFFRDQHKSGEYAHLWKEEPHQQFTITSIGRDLLSTMLSK